MKPFPPPYSNFKRSLPAAYTTLRPLPTSTMRSTVLQSLLLCPDRHGERSTGKRAR